MQIRAPMSTFTGKVGGVEFTRGNATGDLTPEQVGWFKARGYAVTDDAAADATAQTTTPKQLADMTVDELEAEAEARGLAKSGKKAELLERIEDHDTAGAVATAAAETAAAAEAAIAAGGETTSPSEDTSA